MDGTQHWRDKIWGIWRLKITIDPHRCWNLGTSKKNSESQPLATCFHTFSTAWSMNIYRYQLQIFKILQKRCWKEWITHDYPLFHYQNLRFKILLNRLYATSKRLQRILGCCFWRREACNTAPPWVDHADELMGKPPQPVTVEFVKVSIGRFLKLWASST